MSRECHNRGKLPQNKLKILKTYGIIQTPPPKKKMSKRASKQGKTTLTNYFGILWQSISWASEWKAKHKSKCKRSSKSLSIHKIMQCCKNMGSSIYWDWKCWTSVLGKSIYLSFNMGPTFLTWAWHMFNLKTYYVIHTHLQHNWG